MTNFTVEKQSAKTTYAVSGKFESGHTLNGLLLSEDDARYLRDRLNDLLDDGPAHWVRFNYPGLRKSGQIMREGEIVGLASGKFGDTLVSVRETYNSRDGSHDEPRFKFFSAARITKAMTLGV